MASSYMHRKWKYHVFASFHGPDVRKTFMSHLRRQFNENGMTMFDDQEIERGQTITPALKQAIKESRILIVVLSKNYASSGWCLDELVEILKCKKDIGQIVMTVFHGVDPSNVRKQTGEFGRVFSDTCARKTEEVRRRWSQALTDAGNITGEDFQNWDNEFKMIVKISRDVLNKLSSTISWDFEDMVGIEAHLEKMRSLLHLEEDGSMIVGICGPTGIGKSTIARALYSRLSSSFQLSCFMENLKGNYNNGLDEYGLKLCLQEKLLSKILNQNGIRILHLGAIKERLCGQKVLIILDDVSDIKQLEALANETTWFGPGSRIVVTTENQELLQQHCIDNTYHVDFPSREKSLEILCRYAFKQSSSHHGFKELALRVTKLCGNLPLGLRVLGSSLQGKNAEEWEEVILRLNTILHQDIEQVLRVGYESLHENEQSLFLHIAIFFNYKDGDLVKAMFADNNLDISHGINILISKSLIYLSTNGEIVMHKLLQKLGTKVAHGEEPWKHRILIDAQEICDVLERAKGTRAVSSISFNISDINEVCISQRAFKRMPNIRFLKVYKSKADGNDDVVHIPENMEFPQRLRLLHWDVYPKKCLPHTFCPEYLVDLNLRENLLEKLWEGTQPLINLKKMVLTKSRNLKELPDLSKASNLERLELGSCTSLVEIPSTIENLHNLELLEISFCIKLQAVPALLNLASLRLVYMFGCSQLRQVPDISTKITQLSIADTMLEKWLESIGPCSQLQRLRINGSVYTHLGIKVTHRRGADIKKIPDCIKDLPRLRVLYIGGCPKLASLPELPASLRKLIVDTCESLEKPSLPFDSRIEFLHFGNCLKLSQEVRRVITHQSLRACIPGRTIPAMFDHRAIGNYLSIRSKFYRFRLCVVVSPKQKNVYRYLCYRTCINGCPSDKNIVCPVIRIRTEHLCIFQCNLVDKEGWLEQDNEILFEFSSASQDINIIGCGLQILTDNTY